MRTNIKDTQMDKKRLREEKENQYGEELIVFDNEWAENSINFGEIYNNSNKKIKIEYSKENSNEINPNNNKNNKQQCGGIEEEEEMENKSDDSYHSSIDEIEDSLENYSNTYHNIAFLALIENLRSKNIGPYEIFRILGIDEELDTNQSDVAWSVLYQIAKFSNPWSVIKDVQRDDFQILTRSRMQHLEDSMEEAVRLIQNSKRIIVLTGAGVSVSCGIPDFRSAGGVYDQIESKYGLDDPQLLFDIEHLFKNPRPFFEFAKEIYPGNYTPSLAHHFIAHLEKEGKLLRNYTQNIDTLEEAAGITRTVHCHGNFSTATCVCCKKTVEGSSIKDKIMNSEIPYCDDCNNENAFFKPNIVFFGEDLPNKFYNKLKKDKKMADLLIIMGSSLRVEPVANIPEKFKEIPQILINKEKVCPNHEFDVNLLGDADEIVRELCSHLSWDVSIILPPSSIELECNERDESFNIHPDSSSLDFIDIQEKCNLPLFNFDSMDSSSNSMNLYDYY